MLVGNRWQKKGAKTGVDDVESRWRLTTGATMEGAAVTRSGSATSYFDNGGRKGMERGLTKVVYMSDLVCKTNVGVQRRGRIAMKARVPEMRRG